MMNKRQVWKVLAVFLVGLLLLFLLLVGNIRYTRANPGGDLLSGGWQVSGGWLLKGVDPYQASRASQFDAPLFAVLFYGPIGMLPWPTARAVWMALAQCSLGALAALIYNLLGWKARPAGFALGLLFVSLIPSGSLAFVSADPLVLWLLLIGITSWLVSRRRDRAAGLFLALATFLPGLWMISVLWVLFWAVRSRRNAVWVSFMVSFVILVVSFLFLKPDWLAGFLRGRIAAGWNWKPETSVISGLAFGLPGIQQKFSLLFCILIALYAALEWIRCPQNDPYAFLWTTAMTLVITCCLLGTAGIPRQILLAPGMLIGLWSIWDRFGQPGRWILIGYAVLLLAVSCLPYFVKDQAKVATEMLALPPLVTGFGLLWTRWWVLRSPARLIEADG